MANVQPLLNGFVFQARMFWRTALQLLDTQCGIVEVGFENGEDGFDDIWQRYAAGNETWYEHIQCKWHVRQGEFGYANLIDPAFISVKKNSLLQNAYNIFSKAKGEVRCTLITTHRVASSDPLSVLLKSDGSMFLTGANSLSEGKTADSRFGAVRALWCQHLKIDEAELLRFAATLRIHTEDGNPEKLRNELNRLLQLGGFAGVAANKDVFEFDHLPNAWKDQQKDAFNREQLLALCHQNNLFAPAPAKVVQIGVKSFQHEIDDFEKDCVRTLNLLEYFAGRTIKDSRAWQAEIWPKLRAFLKAEAQGVAALRLKMDAHLSLAFAAGVVLDTKSRCRVEFVQTNQVWQIEGNGRAEPEFKFEPQNLMGDASVLVLALELARDAITPAVLEYVKLQGISAGSLITGTLPKTGHNSVRNGEHAVQLAAQVETYIRKLSPRIQHCHLFLCGPNALSFCLGRQLKSLPQVSVYEYGLGTDGQYSHALSWGVVAE